MQAESLTDSFGGLLKLQLKKPKRWRWELTTSKSSPNIALPIVQLYDHHGELLAEANHPDGSFRRSWCSEETAKVKRSNTQNSPSTKRVVSPRKNSLAGEETTKQYKLRSSNAGTLVVSDDSFEIKPRIRKVKNVRNEHCNGDEARAKIHEHSKSDLTLNKFGNYFSDDFVISTAKADVEIKPTGGDVIEDNHLVDPYPMPDYRIFNKNRRYVHRHSKSDLGLEVDDVRNSEQHVKYSKSDGNSYKKHRKYNGSISQGNDGSGEKFRIKDVPKITLDVRKMKRSDDCKKVGEIPQSTQELKMLKSNACIGGEYNGRRLRSGKIDSPMPTMNKFEFTAVDKILPVNYQKGVPVGLHSQSVTNLRNVVNADSLVMDGTLQRNVAGKNKNSVQHSKSATNISALRNSANAKSDPTPTGTKCKTCSDFMLKQQCSSDVVENPITTPTKVSARQADVNTTEHNNNVKSVISPVKCARKKPKSFQPIDVNCASGRRRRDDECPAYTVQEPLTPATPATPAASDRRRPPSYSAMAVNKTRRNRIRLRRMSNETTSSASSACVDNRRHRIPAHRRRRKKKRGDRVLEIDKNPVADLESATKSLQSAPDAVLLRLVRRLTSVGGSHETPQPDVYVKNTLNTTMGANVSRHSGKGLSGRRTQSSGNICNGKSSTHVSKLLGSCAAGGGVNGARGGTPCNNVTGGAVGKERHRFCGSLPNHLDDADDDDTTTNSGDTTESVCYVRDNNNHVSNVVVKAHVPKKQHAPPIPTLKTTLQTYRRRDPDVELKLQPLLVKVANDTALCDQGYGSERSPEDEYPPPIPSGSESGAEDSDPHAKYPFITIDSTFTVTLSKNSRGLGLSVTGGVDSGGAWPGLVRVKRLFPNQPAAVCGLLAPGDLLLAANGLTLTGLTNYEALEVLRTTPSNVVLTVCRPPAEILSAVSPLSDVPPPPPRRDPPCSLTLLPPLTPLEDCYCGEFDIVLTKMAGSLGFTLRKVDESALGHYVRALVREPALSDGRIKPGDKIVAVNDVELSAFSHEEAVQFLRQCGQEVKLRLYRDAAQTPVAALSPTEPEPPHKLKPLRQEAMDMLTDLAVRKMSPGSTVPGEGSWGRSRDRRSASPPNGSSPRRLRRTQRTTPDSEFSGSVCLDDKGSSSKFNFSSQLTSETDSFSRKASLGSDNNTNFSSIESEPDKPIRPNFLNLNSPVTTPTSRKPKFQFSLAHNAYELNNLDADVLDAPNFQYTLNRESTEAPDAGPMGINDSSCSAPEEPVSMPPISTRGFSYKNPSYQSAHPKCGMEMQEATSSDARATTAKEGSKGLLKWKGVVFTPEGSGEESAAPPDVPSNEEYLSGENNDVEILTVELNRGWNSRLGFSLQQGENGTTYISAVHSDSVAAKDGRLKSGDQLLKVNDENVESMTTNNVIDLLRIVRGPVCIVVARKVHA